MFSLINKNKQRVKYFKKISLRSVPVFLLKKILLPFLLLLTITIFLNGCSIINPQTGTLEGVVHRQSSESSEPLSDALISISGSTNTTYTDQDGYFLINEVPAGKRTLTIIKEGYITLKLINVFIEPNIINEVYFGDPIILQPKEDTILYDTAIEFLEQKDYQQAMDTFIELRDTFPDSFWADDAQYYIGNIYEISGLYIAARDEYSLLLFYYPDSSWADNARLGIGNCYYQTGDYYHAKIQYQSVIDNYPLSDLIPLAQYRIAWRNKRLGDNNEAIMAFQQIIALYPESIYAPAAQYFIGEIYYNL
ncbi:MAG: tetratricopeptide repeat protein, partial [Atribacterota bacterium]|nr:tetratricopeptide repeat protein [Atribacterota bacterium]